MIRHFLPRARSARIVGAIALLTGVLAGCDVNPPARSTSTAAIEGTAPPPPAAQIVPSAVPSPTEPAPTPTTTTPLAGDGSRYSPDAAPEMVEALDSLLADEQGIYGVVVAQPDNTVLYSRNADVSFVAASLYKLVLMADLYGLRQTGDLSFDEELTLRPEHFPADDEPPDSVYPDLTFVGGAVTISDAIYNAITLSSNVAAHALIDRVGETSINDTAAALGLTQTYFRVDDPTELADWPPPVAPDSNADLANDARQFAVAAAADGPVTLTTPRDVARFYTLLFRQEIVSRQASVEMLDILKEQQVDLAFPQLLPPGTEMAHKTGNLDHVTHDTGILYGRNGPVILVAMTEATPDDDHAIQIIQRLALIAYGTYEVPPFTENAIPTDAAPADEGVDDAPVDESASIDAAVPPDEG